MFDSFITAFNAEVAAEKLKLGRSLTDVEVDEIARGLSVRFPLIKAPNSARREEGAAIITDGLVDADNVALDAGQTKVWSKTKKDYSDLVVQNMMREFQEAQAAGAVLPIHWIDGTIIGEVLIKSGVLGIHDAIAVGNDFVDRITEMNKATYDTGVGYDPIGMVLEALVESIGAVDDKSVLSNVEIAGEEMTPAQVVELMVEQANVVQEARDKLYGVDGQNKIVVANIADTKGTAYDSSERTYLVKADVNYEDILTNSAVRSKISETELVKIMNKTIKEGC